jgi:NAD(P)H-hydrate epimerase
MTSITKGPEPPCLSSDQMREVDRAMVEDYGILLIQMMENAGRNLAHLARARFLNSNPPERTILVLAGPGDNGGGGMVCARRLHDWGADVRVYLASPVAKLTDVSRHQHAILEKISVPIRESDTHTTLPKADLIVDAILGYGLRGDPRGASAALIEAANAHDAPVLSLDLPSGVDATTGIAGHPAIKAAVTMTLALPKKGLCAAAAGNLVGELYLADISVPPALYARPPLNFNVGPLFATEEIVRIG